MLKEQKTNIFIPSILAVMVISLSTPVAQAELDIDGIYIISNKDYRDGTPWPPSSPWNFQIWVELINMDSLNHIDVTKPGSSTPFTTLNNPPHYNFLSPSQYSTLESLQADYSTGNYTFDFRDSTNTLLRSVTLDYSGLSEPLQAVNFTHPSTDGQTGISTNPMFTWSVDSGAGDALGMWVYDATRGFSIYEIVPDSMTTTSWIPGQLQASTEYIHAVSVFEVKNLQAGPIFPTMAVDGDTFEYGLIIEYCNDIRFTTAYTPGTLSGWVWMDGSSDYGYSLEEEDLLYFFAPGPAWYYNINTGLWSPDGPVDWVYVDWPFLYELDADTLWFVLPPESGLWVYHFSTNQWEWLPRIIP